VGIKNCPISRQGVGLDGETIPIKLIWRRDTAVADAHQHETVPIGKRQSRVQGHEQPAREIVAAVHRCRTGVRQQRGHGADRKLEHGRRGGHIFGQPEDDIQHVWQDAVVSAVQPDQPVHRGRRWCASRVRCRHRPVHVVHGRHRLPAVGPTPRR